MLAGGFWRPETERVLVGRSAAIELRRTNHSTSCAGGLSKNGIAQLRDNIKSCLALKMAASWHNLKGGFQAVSYILRTRQWNIGIVIARQRRRRFGAKWKNGIGQVADWVGLPEAGGLTWLSSFM